LSIYAQGDNSFVERYSKSAPYSEKTDSGPLRLVEAAFLASVIVLIWLVDLFFTIGPFLSVLIVLPVLLAALRWNLKTAGLVVLVSTLLLTVFLGPTRSIRYLIPFGLVSLFLAWAWRRGWSWGKTIPLGAVLMTLGEIFRYALLSVLLGENWFVWLASQVVKGVQWGSQWFGAYIKLSVWQVWLLFLVSSLVGQLVYMLAVHLTARFSLKRLGYDTALAPLWLESRWQRFLP
jgi:uncharacterized protein YybS (DUF2232 family)